MTLTIRDIQPEEYQSLGLLMVDVYQELEGFPSPEEQPQYFETLRNIGELSTKAHTQVLVALSDDGVLLGGVVYFSDMSQYGSGGKATQEVDSSGIRLLAVASKARGLGVGKALTEECMNLAKQSGSKQVVLHTTGSMNVAWSMYERLGFKRSEDLDFMQEKLPVFGFRYQLDDH